MPLRAKVTKVVWFFFSKKNISYLNYFTFDAPRGTRAVVEAGEVMASKMLPVVTVIVLAAAPPAWAQVQGTLPPSARPVLVPGYLASDELPNSLALLPPPPGAGSAALAVDQDFSRRALALRDTKRWALAASDADLSFPHAAETFSCALGADITERDTPHLYTLLRRTLSDAGLATYTAKRRYSRPRPFSVNIEPSCTPQAQAHLAKDGSYPSGHSAAGFAWSLLLSEIAPDRTTELVKRGEVFGQSRVVCNVHWESDVIEGRIVGAATVAKLHGNAAFVADMASAKSELAAVRAKGGKPSRDCSEEAAAIALDPLGAP